MVKDGTVSKMSNSYVIAIDGPSGAGKGTVARALAEALSCRHVDTGAMYRAVAWKVIHEGCELNDDAKIVAIAAGAKFNLDAGKIVVDGSDVTNQIRTSEIDIAAASVARIPGVRSILVAHQRELAADGLVVMEGRDIGTTVFPDAAVKIYLDASPKERAARRAKDPAHQFSENVALGDVESALRARDQQDLTRLTSPLKRAPDAVFVDTTGLAIDRVVSRVVEIVRDTLMM